MRRFRFVFSVRSDRREHVDVIIGDDELRDQREFEDHMLRHASEKFQFEHAAFGVIKRIDPKFLASRQVYEITESYALQKWTPPISWEQYAYGEDFEAYRQEPSHDERQCWRMMAAYEDGAYVALRRVLSVDMDIHSMSPYSDRFAQRWAAKWHVDRLPGYHEMRNFLSEEGGFDYVLVCRVLFRHFEQRAHWCAVAETRFDGAKAQATSDYEIVDDIDGIVPAAASPADSPTASMLDGGQ